MNQHTRVDIVMNVGKIDVRQIHPRDKRFSPNLYWWARREKVCGLYRLTKNAGDYRKGELFVGIMRGNGDFIGNTLRRVMNYGLRKEAQRYAWIHKSLTSHLVPAVAAEKKYLAHGRCGLYPKHDKGFVNQWTYDGDRRTCNFCGKVYVKTKVGERIVEEFEYREAQS